MTANIHDVLASVGPLEDRADSGTPRARLHRFIDDHGVDARSIGGLLSQCHERLGRQHARARQDLIVKLGECLGFEPAYGTYEPQPGTLQVGGQWRSPGGTLVLLDVRSERTPHDDAADLSRAIDAVSSHTDRESARVVGLIVITPFYVSRGPLAAWIARHQRRDVRCVSMDSLVWLAEMRAAAGLAHEEIVRLLTTGLDADFMIALVRRLTLNSGGTLPSTAAVASQPGPLPRAASPRPLMPTERHGAGAHAWIAILSHDETATPRQLLDSVIRRRQILGVSRFVPVSRATASTAGNTAGPVHAPKLGERVFFYIAGEGLVGHATIDAVPSDAASLIRRASRFSTVCRLRGVDVYDVPRFVDPRTAAGRVVYNATEPVAGAVLHAIDAADAAALRAAEPGQARAFVS